MLIIFLIYSNPGCYKFCTKSDKTIFNYFFCEVKNNTKQRTEKAEKKDGTFVRQVVLKVGIAKNICRSQKNKLQIF